ncbi:hypothetical protein VST7929_03199 [Vibrio stylophorae]|uniref:Uncharacterized protein n=1 Tax=Vibrio stylophorae TaxID=659351 RepID=A0ABM8ZXY7_9VIBR|nr:hypothetical protein [Vibrio stylophorae]CAH0535725.1 hypothetical protein VST7929_03199 [Vibrio stylophorae]
MEIEKLESEANALWTDIADWFANIDPALLTLLAGALILVWMMARIKKAKKRRRRELPWGITRVD